MKKSCVKIICICLCLIMSCGLISSSIKKRINDIDVRTINVNQMTYGEQINLLINKFNNYESINNDTSIGFCGDMNASIGEIQGFDFLSEDCESITKTIKTNYNYITNEFYLQISYYADNVLIETIEEICEPEYDDEKDDGYIEYDNVRYYFSETFNSDALDNCLAIEASVAVVGCAVIVCAVVITMMLAPPSVHQQIQRDVKYVTETIIEKVKSFWGWFTKWITKIFTRTKKIETETIITTYTPAITVNNERIDTKEIAKDRLPKLPISNYYLVFIDSTNNKIYISDPIIENVAIAVLALGIKVPCIGNSNKSMLANTYTMMRDNAYKIAVAAGLSSRTPYECPEFEYDFYHYHSSVIVVFNGKEHSPHSFFFK